MITQASFSFIKEIERLKSNTRTAWTSNGRKESIAEHSWRLTMFCMVLEEYLPNLDFNRVLRLSLIHDLGEAFDGDISAKIEVNSEMKFMKEGDALKSLIASLSKNNQQKFME
ncbi:5'-deoxynucleotidase YfbR-like HD superfamily hydrolase [Cytobacillus purgationiresistens]|uniref:5'-deoxynucleotidase YfbR-like HD superfamily hydrolase n=1 Tax=Cytobacillus purgationiresistens TaxID=863449 RepID=A0ABU0AGQ6_9BACI|nr:5'-deoxynucleotidase YfbR-like HD superfamily hydrolase [Cytobacillus purgationiresistens]